MTQRQSVADQLLPGIRTIERSILSVLTEDERAHLLDLLAKVLARAAEQPEPLKGQRIRPARIDRPPTTSPGRAQPLSTPTS